MNNICDLKKRRWLYLALFSFINFFTGALYIWSVFAGPLAERLSALSGSTVTAASLSPVFGLATGITPFLMLAGGFVNDRFGPRLVIGFGGAAIAAGYLTSCLIDSPSLLYVTYGLLVGAGTGLVNGCTINSAVKFFPDRRGFAGGTVTASLGIGAALLPFAAAWLLHSEGIVFAFTAFGTVSGLVIILSALKTEKCPDDFQSRFTVLSNRNSCGNKNHTWIQMIRTPMFYPLFLLFTSSATMGLMLLSNISAIAQTQIGVGVTMAALSVSVISVANTCGRFVSGTLSDRLGRIPTLMLVLTAAVAGLLMLMNASIGDTVLFFTGIICIGICFGAFIGIYPSLVADEYGPLHNSVNFSVMSFGYSVGGLVGPLLIRWANEGGSFDRAYAVCIAAALAGLSCALIALFLQRRDSARRNI